MVAAVQLAPLTGAHADATLRWVSDPDLAAAIGLRRDPSPEGTAAFIARSTAGEDTRAFAILAGEAGRHVGNVVLDEIDGAAARLSIYIGEPEARGDGVGTAATRLALEEAFGPLGLNRVWLIVHERNETAIRAYAAAGFVEESRRPGGFELGDEKLDEITMATAGRDL